MTLHSFVSIPPPASLTGAISVIALPALTGDQFVEIIKGAPAIIAALASLILACKARKDARSAQRSAEAAHERATEAAREHLTFALKRAVRIANLARASDAGQRSVSLSSEEGVKS
jgi:hypothetical protein